jgi:hypothetical protein
MTASRLTGDPAPVTDDHLKIAICVREAIYQLVDHRLYWPVGSAPTVRCLRAEQRAGPRSRGVLSRRGHLVIHQLRCPAPSAPAMVVFLIQAAAAAPTSAF